MATYTEGLNDWKAKNQAKTSGGQSVTPAAATGAAGQLIKGQSITQPASTGVLSTGGDLSAGKGPVAAPTTSASPAEAFQQALKTAGTSLLSGVGQKTAQNVPIVLRSPSTPSPAAEPAVQAGGNDAWATGRDDYGDVDYSVQLQRAIGAGATAAEVQSILDKRTQKALDKGYSQYAYDDVYASAMEYINAQSGQQPKQAADYDLTDYLRRQKADEIESTLAGLKEAYTKGMADYDAALDKLPQRYQEARNDAAAQAATARRNFNEQAAASGLNSGASGQAALDASANYRGALARLNRDQANAAAEIDREKANLTAQYEIAITRAQADGNAALAIALYQELVRLQGLERDDADTAYDRYRDQLSDRLVADQTAYNKDRDALNDQRYDQEYADQRADIAYKNKLQAAELKAQFGRFDGYAELFGLDEATVEEMVAQYAAQKQVSAQQAARDLADWYAEKGDFSVLEELGVNTSNLAAKWAASLKSGSGGGGSGGGYKISGAPIDTGYASMEDIYQLALEQGGSDPTGWIALHYKELGIPYSGITAAQAGYQKWVGVKIANDPIWNKLKDAFSGGGQASAQDVISVKTNIGTAAREKRDITDLLNTVSESGRYSQQQMNEIIAHARACGYNVSLGA